MTHEENLLGAMVPSSDSDHSITSLAYQLHNSVPADRWCVTFLDLDFLREEVQAAVDTTLIQPPANGMDNFNPSDKDYGPSIYSVNEQYTKPMTMTPRFQEVSFSWCELMKFIAGPRSDWYPLAIQSCKQSGDTSHAQAFRQGSV